MRKNHTQRSAHKAQRLRRKSHAKEKQLGKLDQARQKVEGILENDPTNYKAAFSAISKAKLSARELKQSGIGSILKRSLEQNRRYSAHQIARLAQLHLR